MAYFIDGTDIVINGWENGISENPYKGINDMRGINVVSIPGEASVSFAPSVSFLPTCQATISSVDTAADTITVSVTVGSLSKGQAIKFGGTPPAPLTTTDTYWVGTVTGSTFKVFPTPELDTPVNLTSYTGPSSFGTTDIGEIRCFDKTTGIALDTNGRAWYTGGNPSYTSYVYLGNPVSGTVGLSNTIGNGLIWYKEYLLVFYNSRICYLHINNQGGFYVGASWVNEWDPTTGTVSVGTQVFNTPTATANIHEAIIGVNDGTVYITDGHYISSLFEKPGQTFDPANTATYTWAKQALNLPSNDTAQCLEELGDKLLIGGKFNVIYPWDRVSLGWKNVIKIAENGSVHMITVNTNTYIFAGSRGRIYVTNGSQANLYKKIPDHLSGGVEPIFTWKNCAYNKNQLYFGLTAQNNSQANITSYSGLWAIDITTDALREPIICTNSSASVTAIYANTNVSSGFGLMIAWKNGSTYGIDTTGSTPYSDYSPYIISDIIPVGTFLTKRTFQNLEFKLSKPLTANEGIRISGRTDLNGSFTPIGENTITGTISDTFVLPFEQMVWLQLKIELKSSATNSSFVRLFEIRLR